MRAPCSTGLLAVRRAVVCCDKTSARARVVIKLWPPFYRIIERQPARGAVAAVETVTQYSEHLMLLRMGAQQILSYYFVQYVYK